MRSKNLIACILLLLFSITVWAQESAMITGVVTDENKEPLIGVNIAIQNMPGLGVITDINGRYKIKASAYDRLVFSYIGYETVVVLVKEQKTINVKMKEAANTIIDEVVITGTGAQKKIAVTGAITNVDVDALKSVPSTSVVDGLAGVVPGVMAMQTSGRPGSVSEFWIRSISTFGANTAALVLVDGFERDIDEVSVEDIESFTVLKDASATAIYGSKGANGVVLINTKRGKEGKINIDAKVEGFYSTFTKAPEFVDGYTYASMANEARLTRNQEALYSPSELELFRTQLDPDRFPDVDWMDMVLRDGAWSSRATLNMRGGGKTARYFVSGSYQDQQGMYKTDKSLKDYNTNAHFRKWTYRMNVDIDITKTTLLKVGVSGSLRKQNDTGSGTDNLWTVLMGYNSIMMPAEYSDGKIPGWSDKDDNMNPWVMTTQSGYNESWKNNIQTSLTLEQKLDFITKGLRFERRQLAETGILRCAFLLRDDIETIHAATDLLAEAKLSPELRNEALYYRAKAYTKQKAGKKAMEDYRELAKDTRNPYGAEAKYQVAQSLYDAKEYAAAEKELLNYIEQSTPHAYWLARSFVLLSDVYHATGKDLDARQYLLSLQQNYQGNDDIESMIESRLSKLKVEN